jgi:RsiW-degrading membrane proteinase PrsW (M82 family)
MTPGQRWLFQRSRDISLLWKCSAALVGGAILLSGVLLMLEHHEGGDSQAKFLAALRGAEGRTERDYRRLINATRPRPAELARWIRGLSDGLGGPLLAGIFDALKLRVGEMDLQLLIEKHVGDSAQRDLFAQFSRAWLLGPGAAREEAARQVHEAMLREPPLRFAGEFEGDLLRRTNHRAEALEAYLRELPFPDAARPRHEAFALALELPDKAVLQKLCADPRCLREIDPLMLSAAGRILEDRWLVLRSVARMQWEQMSRSVVVPLALFAGAVWYLILVSTAGAERFRWVRYLSPVLAGALSAWLVLWLQSYFDYSPSSNGEKSAFQELLHNILYVGVPEEGAKLCFFALFVPLLWRTKSRTKVALTAGCVGLGFALDENLLYYNSAGVAVAVGRLVTANFMHIAMTGLIGFWFYRMVRSGFHETGEFVTVFLMVTAAHGAYDFAAGSAAQEWGVSIMGIILLALLARYYLHELRPRDLSAQRAIISSTSILFLGLALVVAASIMVVVRETQSLKSSADVLMETLGIIPVAVLFVREFREV